MKKNIRFGLLKSISFNNNSLYIRKFFCEEIIQFANSIKSAKSINSIVIVLEEKNNTITILSIIDFSVINKINNVKEILSLTKKDKKNVLEYKNMNNKIIKITI